jgi:hypothetical protein
MVKRYRIWGADVSTNGTGRPSIVRLHGFCENGMPWTHSYVRIIELIEQLNLEFYYQVNDSEIMIEVAKDDHGRKYLRGQGDTDSSSLLENLVNNRVVFKVEG